MSNLKAPFISQTYNETNLHFNSQATFPNISKKESQTIILAALFHDTGPDSVCNLPCATMFIVYGFPTEDNGREEDVAYAKLYFKHATKVSCSMVYY